MLEITPKSNRWRQKPTRQIVATYNLLSGQKLNYSKYRKTFIKSRGSYLFLDFLLRLLFKGGSYSRAALIAIFAPDSLKIANFTSFLQFSQ